MPMSATTASPHSVAPRQQQMSRLFAHECDRADGRCARRCFRRCSRGCRSECPRQRWAARGGLYTQKIADLRIQGAIQARSKQGIDQQFGAIDERRSQRFDGAAPTSGMILSVIAQCFDIAEQGYTDGPSAMRQRRGGHESVAAVIARTACDADSPGREAALNLASDRLPGILHQQAARCAGRDRQPVRLGHLLDARAAPRSQASRDGADGCGHRHGQSAPERHAQRADPHARAANLGRPAAEQEQTRQTARGYGRDQVMRRRDARPRPSGRTAPSEKLPAEAMAACRGRAFDKGEIPNSSRACEPRASCAMSWSAT